MSATTTDRDPRRDLALVLPLVADDTVWGIGEIATSLRVQELSVYRLWRVTRQYVYGLPTPAWPPSGAMRDTDAEVEVDVPRSVWWPNHASMLPAPDFPDRQRPRWRAGTIRRWAMQTGRMLPDGTAVPRYARGGETRARVKPFARDAGADLAALLPLLADEQPWWIPDIAAALDVSKDAVWVWYRHMLNRWSRGVRTWPPKAGEARPLTEPGGRGLHWWPPHPRLLPAPDLVLEGGPDGRGGNRWRAGTIRRWAMQTGRMLPDGSPARAA